jgi:uncharacterized protein (DUF2267 family)
MDLTDFYERVTERDCCDDVQTADAVHAVLAALALRLEPGEAAGLRRALPKELKPQLAHVEHVLDFDQDAFIEDVAARLDIDDDDAEHVALAVLGAVRDCIRPQRSREQVIESLPSDLAHLMHEIP